MTWLVLAALSAMVLALAIGLAMIARGRRRLAAEAAASRAETEELRARLEDLERRLAWPAHGAAEHDREYVITRLGEETEPLPERVTLGTPAFADALLRETVVHTASLVHGVRRALAPEVRNRIRFEMRREVKRSRKERRVEAREALREYRSRHRAEARDEGSAA